MTLESSYQFFEIILIFYNFYKKLKFNALNNKVVKSERFLLKKHYKKLKIDIFSRNWRKI